MMKLARSDEPPWLMKGSVMPVSGMSRVDAAHDDERLQHHDCGQAHGDERAHVAFGPRRRHESADGEAQVQKQHARRAQKPRLLADGGEDEVAFHVPGY